MFGDNHENAESEPALPNDIAEVVGFFRDDAQLEDAVSRLTLAGFDRAELSLPLAAIPADQATPDAGAAAVVSDVDRRQMRTLGTGIAGAAAALAAAGVTIATGGAAVAAVAAAVIGGGATAAVTNAVGQGVEGLTRVHREEAGAAGELKLAVRTSTTERAQDAEGAMLAAGGEGIHRQVR
jgi:hypothetical protein